MPALLRADPDRGDLLAAAAIVLAVAVSVTDARFEGEWSETVQAVYTVAAAALVTVLALSLPASEGRPPAWHSVLFVVALFLTLNGLLNLADALGAEVDDFPESGTVVWVGLLLAGLASAFARRYDSGISTLLMAVTLVAVGVAFVDWVFSPEEASTFRWVFLFIALVMAAAAGRTPEARPDHAVGFVNAAGVALLAIALTYGILGFFSGGGAEAGAGWEIVLLLGGLALLAYAALELRSGPGYLGFVVLFAFVILAGVGSDDGPSLIGWPIVLLVVAAGLVFAALRPVDH